MILISPYSRPLRGTDASNPKNYPFFSVLVKLLSEKNRVVQLGVSSEKELVGDCRFNLYLKQVAELIFECSFWISVDNFLQHMANHIGKKGVVLWSISDPLLFGYPQNLNILKNRRFLRERQFETWEQAVYNPNAYLSPDEIYSIIKENKFIK